MEIIREIVFDIDKNIYTKIDAKQNDTNSRFIRFTLTNNGLLLNLTGHSVKIYAIKADNTLIFNNVNVEDAANGKVLVELTSQALAIAGDLECELVIYGADSSVLSTKQFTINVIESIRNDSAIESSNEFTALTQGITKLDAWDSQFQAKYDGLNTEYAQQLTENTNKIGTLNDSLNSKAAQSDFNNQQAQINSIVLQGTSGDSSAEVAQNRVDYQGNAFITLKEKSDAVEMGLNIDTSLLPSEKYGVYKLDNLGGVEQGYLQWQDGAATAGTVNVRTKNFITGAGQTLTILNSFVASGYKYRVFKYNTDGTFVSVGNWVGVDKATEILASGFKYKILFSNGTNGNFTVFNFFTSFAILNTNYYTISYFTDREVHLSGIPTLQKNNDGTVTISNYGWIYATKRLGDTITYQNNIYTVLQHDQALYWDLKTNTVSTGGINAMPKTAILFAYNYKGDIQSGFFAKYKEHKSLPYMECEYTSMADGYKFGQDATLTNNYLVMISKSADDHSNTAAFNVFNKSNLVWVKTMTHNLGHAATLDFNKFTNTLIVGNGSTDVNYPARIDLLQNADSFIANNSQINFSTNVLSIVMTDIGNGCGACFGSCKNIVYLLTFDSDGNGIIRKAMLGMGANDLSSGGYGTFLSGKSDNEYNGTLKILKVYNKYSFPTVQGMEYRRGKLWFMTSGTKVVAYEMTLNDDGSINFQNGYGINQVNGNGNNQVLESEGMCHLDDNTLILTVYGDGSFIPDSAIKMLL